MDIEAEIKAIRYLINDLILYTYGLHVKLDTLTNKKKEYNVPEPNVNGNDVAFDLFTIPRKRYNELIEQYGYDIINKACVRLDEFVKVNQYIPYKNTYSALKNKFIKDELFDREKKRESVEVVENNEHMKGLSNE